MIEISALKEPAHPAINNSDNVAAIHSCKVVKATEKNQKSTASECIMAQYKKKGTCDYKLLNNHTSRIMDDLKRQSEKKEKGDCVINRYIDAVVDDIKSRINFDCNVSVYGGSTLAEWQYKNEIKELQYPCVLVKDSIEFSFDNKVYTTISKDRAKKERHFSTEIYPIDLQVTMEVRTGDKGQCEEIRDGLKALYTEPQEVMVTLPMHQEDEFYFTIQNKEKSSNSIQKINKNEGDVYIGKFSFNNIPCVYYDDEQNKQDISNNRKMQINMLKQAAFFGMCHEKLSDVRCKISTNYTCLADRSSLFSFLLPNDLKMLKKSYDSRMPLDKDLFRKVFGDAVDVYPNLYDKAIQRWSWNKVREDIIKYHRLFRRKSNEICIFLNVCFTQTYNLFEEPFFNIEEMYPHACTTENLNFYIELMEKKSKMSLKKAISIKENEIREKNMNVVVVPSTDANGGILSEVVKQSMESHNIKRHAGDRAKQDLIGQAGCAKSHGGNCSNCSIRMGCSRYFF